MRTFDAGAGNENLTTKSYERIRSASTTTHLGDATIDHGDDDAEMFMGTNRPRQRTAGHGRAMTRELLSLADRAKAVRKRYNDAGGIARVVAEQLRRSPAWVSKMLRVDEAMSKRSIAGKLVAQGKGDDVELGGGRAMTSELLPLADRAKGVRKRYNDAGGIARVVAAQLRRSEPWVSKMLRVAEAMSKRSIAGKLVAQGKVDAVELAYSIILIEELDRAKAQQIADNIANETRSSTKQALRLAKRDRSQPTARG